MTNDEFKALGPGDLVRHKDSTGVAVAMVNATYGNRVTAVATYDLINPEEWVLLRKMSLIPETSRLMTLLQEAADLAATRDIPEDLNADMRAVSDNVAMVGGSSVVDGRLQMEVIPTPQFIAVLERLRECRASSHREVHQQAKR